MVEENSQSEREKFKENKISLEMSCIPLCLKDFAESLETKLLVYQSVHKMEFFIQAPSIHWQIRTKKL